MKQLLQHLRTGRTYLADVPAARPGPREVLIRTHATLISPGTERMLLEFGRANWIGKARQQPDKVRQVWEKFRREGWAATREAVESKLDRSIGLGYAQTGLVVAVGESAERFAPGDRVVSNGPHAEWVTVPETLCARVPDGVADDEAPAAILGAIALESLRRIRPQLGESMLVIGLGPVGLLVVQLLRAHGCRVLATDLSTERLALARSWGAQIVESGSDLVSATETWSGGRGVDGVILATATQSADPLRRAAPCCRPRARIVLVGTAKLDVPRDEFYRRELCLEVSCSYGPGRYDPAYERDARDYPIGHVRWTAQRNIEAVLELMDSRRLEVAPLITHRFPHYAAPAAYELLAERKPGVMAILLEHAKAADPEPAPFHLRLTRGPGSTGRPGVAVIGAGDHARRALLPALRQTGIRPVILASRQGTNAAEAARQFGFTEVTTDLRHVFDHPDVKAVVIATPHATHASLVVRAIEASKAVFVEKPLADTWIGLRRIERSLAEAQSPLLLTGFNRRFAPLTIRLKDQLDRQRGPKSLLMTVNAGHAVLAHDRVIGEACHFIDLLRYLAGAPVEHLDAVRTAGPDPSATIHLRFADGSIGAVHYLTQGHRAMAKERLEVFAGGRSWRLDNFRQLNETGRFSRPAWFALQDKGHSGLVRSFVEAVESGAPSPIPIDEQIEVTALTLEAAGRWEGISETAHQERECA